MKRVLPSLLLLVVGLFSGCATYDANHDDSRSIKAVRHFFVVSNANDNRALDRHIATALRARGFAAETGPLTMMGEEVEAIVTYQDQWSWDFGDHLVFLQITVRDRKSDQPFSLLKFATRVPTRATTGEIVDGLVGRLFADNRR